MHGDIQPGGVLAEQSTIAAAVASVVATNALETWEGAYSFREAVPIQNGNRATNLCLCIYGRDGGGGNLLGVYAESSSGVR